MATDWGRRADALSADALAAGQPTAWFDRLYAEADAGSVSLPWNRTDPHPLLRQWLEERPPASQGTRAVVVGCGLGADAGHLASLGYDTMAFDISPTAVRLASERFPSVRFEVGDLLALPAGWRRAFDLVVEIHTLQAVPDPPRSDMLAGVAALVADGGTLLTVQLRDDGSVPAGAGPPFALAGDQLLQLASHGLELVRLESLDGPLWRAEFGR